MRYFITTIALISTILTANAQNFEKAVGIRLGYTNAIFFEKQNDELSSSRYMLNWRENGRQFTAMKIFRNYDLDQFSEFKLGDIAGKVSFYYGYGAHAGYIKWEQHISDEKGQYFKTQSAPVFGLDGIMGLSYDFKRLPLAVTLDTKPFFDYWGRRFFKLAPFDIAIGAVYVF
jgi:hypothetical protein